MEERKAHAAPLQRLVQGRDQRLARSRLEELDEPAHLGEGHQRPVKIGARRHHGRLQAVPFGY